MRNANRTIIYLQKDLSRLETQVVDEKDKVKLIRTQMLYTLKSLNLKAWRLATALINMESDRMRVESILGDFSDADFEKFRKIGWIELRRTYNVLTNEYELTYMRTKYFERVFMS